MEAACWDKSMVVGLVTTELWISTNTTSLLVDMAFPRPRVETMRTKDVRLVSTIKSIKSCGKQTRTVNPTRYWEHDSYIIQTESNMVPNRRLDPCQRIWCHRIVFCNSFCQPWRWVLSRLMVWSNMADVSLVWLDYTLVILQHDALIIKYGQEPALIILIPECVIMFDHAAFNTTTGLYFTLVKALVTDFNTKLALRLRQMGGPQTMVDPTPYHTSVP